MVSKHEQRERLAFFNTAEVYSHGASEVATGRLLRKPISRGEVVVATKVNGAMTSGPNGRGPLRKHVLSAIDASLERLGIDYVDLYHIHPSDRHTPLSETMEALHHVVRAGKARYIGASSMYPWEFAKARHVADRHGFTRFVSMQNYYNLYREEEREMIPIPQCLGQGVGVIPWSSPAPGFLTGTRTREGDRTTTRAQVDRFTDSLYGRPDFDVVDRVAELASERGVPPAQVALAWRLPRPGVTAPIVGATKPGDLEDALAAERLSLDEAEIARLEEPYVLHPVLGHG